MSYGVSAALQEAVYQALVADADLAALVGAAIYDVVPAGTVPGTYVTLGPEDVHEQSDVSGTGAAHRLTISVVTNAAGFQTAKRVGAAISDALIDADLVLTRGRLVSLNFLRALARRVQDGDVRRIDLTFRARVEDE
jgi:hypothetical protein